ncbi:MAG: cell division topological specificity factor MinE [Blautia sp.]
MRRMLYETFFQDKRRSAGYARDRMKVLLISERMECSPQMMKMLKKDLIHTVRKYVAIEENKVKIQITQEPTVLMAYIPVVTKKDR